MKPKQVKPTNPNVYTPLQVVLALYAMHLSLPRVATTIKPEALITRGKGRNTEFLVNRKQLIKFADDVFEAVIKASPLTNKRKQ